MFMVCGTIIRNFEEESDAKGFAVFKANFNKYLWFLGLDYSSRVPADFLSSDSVGIFKDYLLKNGASPGTVSAVGTKLKRIGESYIRYILEKNLKETSLKGIINYCIEQSGKSKSQIANDNDIPVATLNKWTLGQQLPSMKHLESISRLEEYFKLPPKTLSAQIGTVIFGNKGNIVNAAKKTDFDLLLAELGKLPYALSFAK